MWKDSEKQQKYYFSERLKKQLDQISHYPLTVVEAPSGFGKTTAVREYLKKNLPHGTGMYWYTCLGESSSMAWIGICELFSHISEKVANSLKNLKMPDIDTLYYVAKYLKDIHCDKEIYLVIDNYQLVNSNILYELINVFSMHGNSNLHIIFITQHLDNRHKNLIFNDNIYFIDTPAFFFDIEGISKLSRMKGLRLTDDDMEEVFLNTGGWIAAIQLQMISFVETGSFTLAANNEQLVEKVIWSSLDLEEKDFLLSVSVLDNFTVRQAIIMINQDKMPDKIYELLKNNNFIKYLPDKFLYSIHSILLNYIRNRFYYHTSQDFQNDIYEKAGKACSAISQYCLAAEFYYKIKDFDAILSMPFTREYLEGQKEKYLSGFCAAIVRECPDEILCKYPFSMLVFGYMTLMNGYRCEYEKLCKLLNYVMQNGDGYSQEQLKEIKGEYILLEIISEFNDVAKMKNGLKRYWEIMKTSIHMIKENTPWLFGGVSILSMFWRETGKLKNVFNEMSEGLSIYQKISQGYGAGTLYAMQAEAMLMRGKDNEAETLCYKALYEARSYKQIDICLCIELILTSIHILRGDVEAYFTSIKKIQTYPNENSGLYVLRMVEHCMSQIGIWLGIKEYIYPWFYDMENIKKAVYVNIVPHAQLIHLGLLILEKRYNEFYGACEHALSLSSNPAGNIKYIMPQIYQIIFLSIAKRNNGEELEAQEYLKKAISIALQDEIYLPFTYQDCMEDFISELCTIFNGSDKIQEINIIMELCKRQKKGIKTIRKAICKDKSDLTPREREIALLAKERLSSKEIANKLYISDMTVRTTLRSIYKKLDIHSRAELRESKF